jgi:hypothetical protein
MSYKREEPTSAILQQQRTRAARPPELTFSMLYFSNAALATSTASCARSSLMSILLMTARSMRVPEVEIRPGVAAGVGGSWLEDEALLLAGSCSEEVVGPDIVEASVRRLERAKRKQEERLISSEDKRGRSGSEGVGEVDVGTKTARSNSRDGSGDQRRI